VRADPPRRRGHITGPGAARPGIDLPLGDPGAARRRRSWGHDPGVPRAVGLAGGVLVHVPARAVPGAPPGRAVLLRRRRRRRAAAEAALLPRAGRVAVRRLRARRARGAAAREVPGRGRRGHAVAARRLRGVRGRHGPRAACGGSGAAPPAWRQRDVRRGVLLLRGEAEAADVRTPARRGRAVVTS